MKQKYIILGLIIMVAIALVAFMLVQPTSILSSDTGTSATTAMSTTWKTYTDAIGDYSISYPSKYSVWPVNTKDPSFVQPNDHTIISQVGFGMDPNAGPGGFSVSVSNSTYTDPVKWVANQDATYGGYCPNAL